MQENRLMQIRLTPRLQAVADLVEKGARLADIGTDHAHLPIYLLQQGRISEAIASDIRPGPLARAQRNVEQYQVGHAVDLRLGMGLACVRADECDTLSIAGMGGETISQVLQAAPWTAAGRHRLILQPMTMVAELRQWLWAHGYSIEKEAVCREERRWYLALGVQGGAPRMVKPLGQCCISQALLAAPLARDYLSCLLAREKRALDGLLHARQPDPARLAVQKETVETILFAWEGLS